MSEIGYEPLSSDDALAVGTDRSDDVLPSNASDGETDDATGEELYVRARSMPHRLIPDFFSDGEYLELLGKSAEKGYPRALAKLGEYAMRRKAWIEAYYWMKLAERKEMEGLTTTLREIRRRWAQMYYPVQSSNEHELFSKTQGSIGRALLNLDSGHDAAAAKAFLKEHHPEFLT